VGDLAAHRVPNEQVPLDFHGTDDAQRIISEIGNAVALRRCVRFAPTLIAKIDVNAVGLQFHTRRARRLYWLAYDRKGLLISQRFVYTFDTNGIEWRTRCGSHD